jgi:hypothetical protein
MDGPKSLQKYVKSKVIEIDQESNIVFQKKNASAGIEAKLVSFCFSCGLFLNLKKKLMLTFV